MPDKRTGLSLQNGQPKFFWTSASLFACAEQERLILGHYRNFLSFCFTELSKEPCEFLENIRADF